MGVWPPPKIRSGTRNSAPKLQLPHYISPKGGLHPENGVKILHQTSICHWKTFQGLLPNYHYNRLIRTERLSKRMESNDLQLITSPFYLPLPNEWILSYDCWSWKIFNCNITVIKTYLGFSQHGHVGCSASLFYTTLQICGSINTDTSSHRRRKYTSSELHHAVQSCCWYSFPAVFSTRWTVTCSTWKKLFT